MRLVSGSAADPSSGKLQLRMDGVWVDFVERGDNFDNSAAAVVCRALGWIGGVATWTKGSIPTADGPCVFLQEPYRARCSIDAEDLQACSSYLYNGQCTDGASYEVSVACSDSKGGRVGQAAGRVSKRAGGRVMCGAGKGLHAGTVGTLLVQPVHRWQLVSAPVQEGWGSMVKQACR